MDYPRLSADQAAQLRLVERSKDHRVEYAPCRVTCVDGTVLDGVVVAEASVYLDLWGEVPADAHQRRGIPVEDVALIEESPFRLPAALANELYRAGESGMGYFLFTVVMSDGSRLPFTTGGIVDFPDWPPGVDARDAVGVLPHEGREHFLAAEHAPHTRSADFAICLYSV